jgi:hypothetical protein
MKTLCLFAVVAAGLGRTAAAQGVVPLDSLFVSGEAASSPAVGGGGGGVDWLHPMSARSTVSAGVASMRLGNEAWTYGTLGGITRRGGTWYSGSVGLGAGRLGQDAFPYVRVLGAATIPMTKVFAAETEAQFARLNGTTVKVIKAGTLYSGLQKTSVRIAYVGASVPLQYWQYLFSRGDVSVGRVGALAGFTAGRGPTHLGPLGPELLLHTSQEIFFGGSVQIRSVRTIGVAQLVRQSSNPLTRLIVTLQVPLGSQPVTSETTK